MAKINIDFNDTSYEIDETSLSKSIDSLKSHLETLSGTGTTINFNGTNYNIDSTKFSVATNNLTSYLNTIAGTGKKVVINGVEYGIDSNKVAGAIAKLEDTLNNLKPMVLTLAPGLYQPGAIALYETGDYEAASAMLRTSWDELISQETIFVDGGIVYAELGGIEVVVPDLPEKNEYGFYYGVGYVISYGEPYFHLKFYKDGTIEFYQDGALADITPPGFAIYSENRIDATAVNLGIIEVINDGQGLANEFGEILNLGEAGILNGDLVIPENEGIVAIGDYAFSSTSLNEVAIPDSVTSIGDCAFEYCPLTRIEIGNNITNIGIAAFANCGKLQDAIVLGEVTTISSYAFQNCYNLVTTTIPATVTNINEAAFSNCNNLRGVYYSGTYDQFWHELYPAIGNNNGPLLIAMNYYADATNCLYDSTGFVYSPLSDNTYSLVGYNGRSAEITTPTTYNGKDVTRIYTCAFANRKNLTNITISSGMSFIDVGAFQDCSNLVSIDIPNTIIGIDYYVFANCSSLASIKLPEGLTTIESALFENCSSLATIRIPSTVTKISDQALENCINLTNIVFNGTIDQWNIIKKQDPWNLNVPATYVQCIDGQVAI